jgi:hypothetical protein
MKQDAGEIERYSGNQGRQIGYCLLLEPTPAFYDMPQVDGLRRKSDMRQLWKYFTPHKKIFIQLLTGMVVSSGIMLVAPFLTQALVDKGINKQDLGFIYLILAGQLALFAGGSIADIIRSKLLLHMGTRINIAMVSDFLAKMLRLRFRFLKAHHRRPHATDERPSPYRKPAYRFLAEYRLFPHQFHRTQCCSGRIPSPDFFAFPAGFRHGPGMDGFVSYEKEEN